MIVSERRLAANRRNARLSSGPRTRQGKLISRNNALRHGLARPLADDPAAARAIDDLTAALAGTSNDPWYRELARQVAECIADLERIRAARHEILGRIGEFEKADAGTHKAAAKLLERIARYEQRARARRRKALRALNEAGAGGAES
jgi:hypothetical protein